MTLSQKRPISKQKLYIKAVAGGGGHLPPWGRPCFFRFCFEQLTFDTRQRFL